MNEGVNFLVYQDCEGELHDTFYDSADDCLFVAAKIICFGDCTDEKVDMIVVDDREVEYAGWQPGMLFEFYDVKTGEIVWSRSFPSWDH